VRFHDASLKKSREIVEIKPFAPRTESMREAMQPPETSRRTKQTSSIHFALPARRAREAP